MVRGPAGSATSVLLEREAELARVDQLIAAAMAGAGHVLVIEGRAGIGKTALLTELRSRAEAAGMTVCLARASELEGEFAFGVVRQLFEAVVRSLSGEESSRLLAGAAALAAPVLGLEGERVPGGPFAALHGLYWLAADISSRAPLLLAVDDVHWADLPSLHWLAFLLRRLEGLPILVAVTTRPAGPGPQGELVASLMAESGVELMQVGSLGERSIAALVERAFGTEPDARFTAACLRATAGNPLALHAVIGDLVAQGVRPTGAAAATLEQQVPVALAHWTLTGLARLGDAALRFARALAVMGDGSEVRPVGRLAGLRAEAASEVADRLVAADLLVPVRPPRFAHPLLRAAVYDDIPLGVRSDLHRRAADLLGAVAADAEAVAAHLLRSEPGEATDTVEWLRAAAQAGIHRGAPQAAIAYLRRALAETISGPARVRVLAEMGQAELLAGDHGGAAHHLREAVAACPDPVTRAKLRNDQADAVRAEGDRRLSLRLRLQALEDLGDRDPEASERIWVRTSVSLLNSRHVPPQTTDPIERLRDLAAGTGTSARSARLALGFLLAARGEPAGQVRELVDRGLDDGAFLAEETSDSPAVFWAAQALLQIEELSRASALAADMQAEAAARGSTIGFSVGSLVSAWASLRRGLLADAEAGFRATLEITQPHDLLWTAAAVLLAETLMELGRADAARAQIEDAPPPPGMEADLWHARWLAIRGRVRCGIGQTDLGIADLRSCGELGADIGIFSPAIVPWRSELAATLAAHSPEAARHLVETDLLAARRAGIPSAIGSALRALAALRPDQEAVELLAEAAILLESSPAVLTRARVLLDLGAALRRLGRRVEAREPLGQALEIATACGAVPLADRARQEAILAGARPRRPRLRGLDALTPAELRTARLASEGRTNREIAQALFITAKTVGDHLGAAYGKLGINSRAELSEALRPRD